jgi:hypothetical protein
MKIAHISLADWNEAVTGMTLEEEGFYWRLTRLLYSTPSGSIADNDADAAKLMNVGVRVYRRLKDRMLGWHKETVAVVEGRITNDRVVEEITKYCDAKKAAVARGQAGAAKRWGHQVGGSLPEVSSKFAGSLPEVSPKLGPNFDAEPRNIKGLAIATPTPTPTPVVKDIEADSPPSPPRGDAHGGENWGAPRRVAHPKGETPNPYRPKDPLVLNPGDCDPQVVGIGWSPEGELQVFNGTKVELLRLTGSEEQLRMDLLAVSASPLIGPSTNLHMLKNKVRGLVADRVDKRAQSDRRYQQAVVDKGNRKPGSAPPRPKLKIDDLPPTTDPQEVARRFEMFLEEAPKYQSERDRWWPRFQQSQAEKARSAGLIS